VLSFNHRASVERHSLATFNIGAFYKQYGNDPNYFRAVNLSDAAFQQREVHLFVDGGLAKDFERHVNSVTVTLRKQHQDGETTVQEVVLDGRRIGQAGDLRMVYGWSGDHDRAAWLDYEYRTRWSFQGGGVYETEWSRASSAAVSLVAPYQIQTIAISGSGAALKAKKVRSVPIQIVRPVNAYEYGYVITWQLEGGRRLVAKGHDDLGVVFVDELPSSEGS
jgi:hypothetical protein